MAGSGVFPKLDGDIIYAADFNTIKDIATGVVVNYYGNSPDTSLQTQVAGQPVVAAQLTYLWNTINKAYKHQVGDFSNAFTARTAGVDVINNTEWNTLKQYADFIELNKDTVAEGFGQLSTQLYTTAINVEWNGLHTWAYTFSWPSVESGDNFFNSGGRFTVDVGGTGPGTSTPKDLDWQNNILNAIPIQVYAKGNWLSGSPVDVYEYGNTAQYTENYCRIFINRISSNQLYISVTLNDADVGDQQGGVLPGPAVDENVGADAAGYITVYTSTDAIVGQSPTGVLNSNW